MQSHTPKLPRKKRHLDPVQMVIHLFMAVLLVLFMVPLIWVVRTAFIPDAFALDLFAVASPTTDNITQVLSEASFDVYYLNTFLLTGGILVVQFVFITLAGYAFARMDFYGSKLLFIVFLGQIMIAPEVLLFPNYLLLAKFKLTNTLIGVMLPFFASGMGTLIVRQTIKTIPIELEEAARIDGASPARTLLQIYVPLLKPAYLSFGMISVAFQWNNFLWPLVMINSASKRPLALGLAVFAMSYETGPQWSDIAAATVLVCAPLILLFVIFQRQFMDSFIHAGIK